MNYTSRSIATALAGMIALGPGSMTISAQVTVDLENRYSNVGVIMVWRVDDAGKPVELRGFASGTLIRDRVMVTAGHFTARRPLGSLPPSIRIFASFSPTDAQDPKTWIPAGPASDAPLDAALSAAASMRPDRRHPGRAARARDRRRWAGLPRTRAPGIKPARFAAPGTLDRSEGAPTTIVGYGTTTPRGEMHPRAPRCGTESGASGLRHCEESSTRPGHSGPSPATFAQATRVAAFF